MSHTFLPAAAAPSRLSVRRRRTIVHHVPRTLWTCVLLLSLGACTMPKKAPTDSDAAAQPGGSASVPSLPPLSEPPVSPIDRPPMLPKEAAPASEHAPAVTQPQPLVRPAPDYPSSLSADGIEGQVVVRYTVNVSGRAHNVLIVRASHPQFAREVRRALARWRFEPARDAAGNAVPAQAQQSFQFRTAE